MTTAEILDRLPFAPPYHFVGTLDKVNASGAEGSFYFDPALPFYRGHFRERPVTPGSILTEVMAQIGLACLGIYLAGSEAGHCNMPFALTAAAIEYLAPVFPGEHVRVYSEKIYFRFGKLKCRIIMNNASGTTVCEGILSGMMMNEKTYEA